jgi:hypothetical protein
MKGLVIEIQEGFVLPGLLPLRILALLKDR